MSGDAVLHNSCMPAALTGTLMLAIILKVGCNIPLYEWQIGPWHQTQRQMKALSRYANNSTRHILSIVGICAPHPSNAEFFCRADV